MCACVFTCASRCVVQLALRSALFQGSVIRSCAVDIKTRLGRRTRSFGNTWLDHLCALGDHELSCMRSAQLPSCLRRRCSCDSSTAPEAGIEQSRTGHNRAAQNIRAEHSRTGHDGQSAQQLMSCATKRRSPCGRRCRISGRWRACRRSIMAKRV